METIPKPDLTGPQNLATPSRVLLGGEPRCANCDTSYTGRDEMLFSNDPELCDKCLATERIFRVTVGEGKDTNVLFCAGLSHIKQRIEEEIYWPYLEFSNDEFTSLEQEHFALESILMDLERGDQSIGGIQHTINRYTDALQKFWNDGVTRGVLSTDPQYRVWPIRFAIKVEELTREEGKALVS
jgi:hypothetical protein